MDIPATFHLQMEKGPYPAEERDENYERFIPKYHHTENTILTVVAYENPNRDPNRLSYSTFTITRVLCCCLILRLSKNIHLDFQPENTIGAKIFVR